MGNVIKSKNLHNKTCLVTGGTSGVGRATAKACALAQATVVLTSRQAEKAQAAAKTLQAETGNPLIIGRALDLADPMSIQNFAADFRQDFKAVHVLSNNAAILPLKKEYTVLGIEKIFAVNYLGHFMLTFLLEDLLIKSAPSRILTVSGGTGVIQRTQLDLDDLNLEKQHYNPLKATIRAALAKVAFSHELAKRLKDKGVTSNTFHPGLVRSNLPQHLPQPFKFAAQIGNAFFSPDCSTSAYLATSPDVTKVTGKFFSHSKIVKFSPRIPLDDFSAELWEKSKQITNLE